MVPRRAVDGPLIPVLHACRESFGRPYGWEVLVLPPQRLFGHSKVSLPICRFWNLFVEEEVLPNRRLHITVWNMLWIIRCSCDGVFFPRKVSVLNYPYELA